MITIGSLFDGIGGFPLAAQRNGMKAIWASEIEPFPIKVTKIRFPEMKHLGDITKINGAEIEPVDIITGGSPCQDLSVAGKRAGMKHTGKGDEETTRSGLFMEQVRIVREMRENEKRNGRTGIDIRPRFMVWENVPGAFSSNKGEDFRAVLEETARIADETAVIPGPPKGKWNTAGCIMGDSWSIAWRVLDAEYWGVPQRRRRIYLVADFGGQSAPEVLFKSEGLSRHLAESRKAREGIAADVKRGFRETGPGYWGEGIGCLRAEGENRPSRPSNIIVKTNFKQLNDMECEELLPYCPTTPGDGETKMLCEGSCCGIAYKNYIQEQFEAIAIDSNCQDSRFKLTGQIVPTIPAKAGTGGNNGPMLAIPINDQATHTNRYSNGSMIGNPGEPMYSLTAQDKHSVAVLPFDTTQITSPQNGNNPKYGDPCHPLAAGAHPPAAVINCEPSGISGTVSSKWAKGTGGPAGDECQNLVCRPLRAQSQHSHREDLDNVILQQYSVRRLTPLECERLQDFPDGWTDIPGGSDSARYKALGNSIAVCCAEYVLEGIKEAIGG